MKIPHTLFLLAADQDYRLLSNKNGGPDLVEITHRVADDFADVHYTYSSSAGGRQSAPSGNQFGTDSGDTEHEQERGRFAKHVVAALAEEWAKGSYDRIVVSAGPKMLGVLRDAMPKSLTPHIASEMHKDLIKTATHDLPSHFKDVMGV